LSQYIFSRRKFVLLPDEKMEEYTALQSLDFIAVFELKEKNSG